MSQDWFNDTTAPVFAAGGGGVWAVLAKEGTTKREAGAALWCRAVFRYKAVSVK